MFSNKFIISEAYDLFFNMEIQELESIPISAALNSKDNQDRRVSIENYFDIIIPRYTDLDFKAHFRVTRNTMEVIAAFVLPVIHADTGRPQCNLNKQLLITLWYLGNQETFRSLSDRFDMTKSSIREIVYRILDILILKTGEYIKWPTYDEAKITSLYFTKRNGFPGIIGCIDGCHIPIAKPSSQPEAYINRKGYYSLILQGVCNEKRKFIDVECGLAGSMHDARVLRKTHLGRDLQDNQENIIFSNEMHLIGDSAYPLTNYLLTPYRDNGHLTVIQKRFNYRLSSNRIRIEHSFGILRARFRILKFVNVRNTTNIPKIILGCCVLHNICMSKNDSFEETEPEEVFENQGLGEEINRIGNLKRDYIGSIL